ncbi:MAG: DUF1622 domain-containing protein [Plesiomonas sp.]|uniref:DUF1622 domain-containing protein n=1 Tax=Plesiomonas sp. TaxID=2486279 RepID=UPI003F33E22A
MSLSLFDLNHLKLLTLHGVEILEFALELISVACVLLGLIKTLWLASHLKDQPPGFRHIRVCFGSWLALALEFQLAADILATTVAPNKEELVRLAIIALIRTFLNYFLAKELDTQAEKSADSR